MDEDIFFDAVVVKLTKAHHEREVVHLYRGGTGDKEVNREEGAHV